MRLNRESELFPCYLGFILEIRRMHPGMGLRSIYDNYQPEGIGRDAFIADEVRFSCARFHGVDLAAGRSLRRASSAGLM